MKYLRLFSLGISASVAAIVASEVWANVWRTTVRMSGFSANSTHYIYLESSRDSGAGIPSARMQIVNVPANSCVTNGCIRTGYSESEAERTTIKMAEDELLGKTWNLRQSLKLVPPNTGTRLNIISKTKAPDGSEIAVVRLNNSGQMQIRLEQKQVKPASPDSIVEVERAAMRLLINYRGRQRIVGSLNNFREGAISYSLREVRLSPNGRNVVVLLDMTLPTFEGRLQTTLVQGFTL